MRIYYFNEKENTIYINTNVLLGNMNGMTLKDKRKYIGENFKLTYEERIQRVKDAKFKEAILKALSEHIGCEISEFSEM